MSEIEIRPIPDEITFARKMVKMTRDDGKLMGHSDEYLNENHNPDDRDRVQAQLEKLKGNEKSAKRRLGAFVIGESDPDSMVAFSVTGNWSLGDELQYVHNPLTKLALREKSAGSGINRFIGRPIGAYSMVGDLDVDPVLQTRGVNLLLDELSVRADDQDRDVRMSFYPNDPSAELYLNHGFETVAHRSGRPFGPVVQKLMVRHPSENSIELL